MDTHKSLSTRLRRYHDFDEDVSVRKGAVAGVIGGLVASWVMKQHFDVAILDIGMPAVDGCELLRRIRQRSANRNRAIPAAALTAYARAADRTRSLQAGFQMHLSKPIEPTELAAAVFVLAGDLDRSTT